MYGIAKQILVHFRMNDFEISYSHTRCIENRYEWHLMVSNHVWQFTVSFYSYENVYKLCWKVSSDLERRLSLKGIIGHREFENSVKFATIEASSFRKI